ncbi:hypothetical protein H310_05977 [Aphanomyces invadans]|uniref:Uncharacterized protein n=1 Tax=Aphanomyces invadans TaxID=157072 RepID=A0A024U7S8_9STRA|nr:hypothetical protein H310_05977 [Aphanomyces invadans]ETW02476.1 hypothetical protein H310_05977 [Aphanomyces invadans]|eukprot:XP_008869081.1 hypothetical protein H310_05977 [Aphanomyces invadans]
MTKVSAMAPMPTKIHTQNGVPDDGLEMGVGSESHPHDAALIGITQRAAGGQQHACLTPPLSHGPQYLPGRPLNASPHWEGSLAQRWHADVPGNGVMAGVVCADTESEHRVKHRAATNSMMRRYSPIPSG